MKFAGSCNIQLQRDSFSISAEFDIPSSGVLGIYGHSGSGKTTLLRCIAGLEKNVQGEIIFNDTHWLDQKNQLPTQQRKIGYIFQESRLFCHLNVEDNLNYGARRNPAGTSDNTLLQRNHLLQLLNIEHLLNRMPDNLSGGEKQRVAIARALLKNPQLLLMDEPLAALDNQRKREILPFLERLHDELNIPMLYVSHSLEEVSRLCDYMLVMEQGRIRFKGDLHETLVSPDSPLSREENAAAIIECNVLEQHTDYQLSTVESQHGTRLKVQGILEMNRHIRLRILATDICLCNEPPCDSSILNVIAGNVSCIVAEKGAGILLQVDASGDIFLVRISRMAYDTLNISPGKAVYLQIKTVEVN